MIMHCKQDLWQETTHFLSLKCMFQKIMGHFCIIHPLSAIWGHLHTFIYSHTHPEPPVRRTIPIPRPPRANAKISNPLARHHLAPLVKPVGLHISAS